MPSLLPQLGGSRHLSAVGNFKTSAAETAETHFDDMLISDCHMISYQSMIHVLYIKLPIVQ